MTTPAAVRPHTLAAELAAARSRTDFLFTLLTPEALYARPIPERHRMIFYVGHLEAFDWNMICRRTLGLPSFHPEFDRLFEFGIDPPEGSLPVDTEADWPRVKQFESTARASGTRWTRFSTRLRNRFSGWRSNIAGCTPRR